MTKDKFEMHSGEYQPYHFIIELQIKWALEMKCMQCNYWYVNYNLI